MVTNNSHLVFDKNVTQEGSKAPKLSGNWFSSAGTGVQL